MSYSPLLPSPLSSSQRMEGAETEHFAARRPSEEVIATLRSEIQSGARDLNSVLGTITVAAQLLTGADGAALAMLRNGAFVCMGSSGDAAPALGAIVNTDSGISGECIRTGDPLLCDDAETDPRVDAAVCRRLGLRSIAVAPIRSSHGAIGLLEIFATAPSVFASDHVSTLLALGDLVPVIESQPGLAPYADPGPALPTFPSLRQPSPESHRSALSGVLSYRKPILTGSSVGLLILLAAIAWKTWSQPKTAESAAAAPAPIPTESLVSNDAPADTQLQTSEPATSKPSPARTPQRIVERGVISAASVQIARDVVRPVATAVSAPTPVQNQTPVPPSPETEKAPEVVASAKPSDSLNGLLAYSVAPPKYSPRISEGVIPQKLEHSVQPTYPAQARALGIQGEVQLAATITEDGSVKNIKTVTGNRVLAEAAIAAVQKWRYRPAMLNGKPVSADTKITITFRP